MRGVDAALARAARSLTATSGSGAARATAARVEQPPAERGPHVDVDDEQVLVELLAAGDEVRRSRRTRIDAPSNTSSSWPPTRFT